MTERTSQKLVKKWKAELDRLSKRYEQTKPPKGKEEAKEQGGRRAEILENSSGDRRATSSLSSPIPAPAVIGLQSFVEGFTSADPYLTYPEHGKKLRIMRHAHCRGKTLHFDARRQLTDDYLVGWTENVQKRTIKKPILTLGEAKRICKGYSIEDGNRYLKPLVAKGRTETELGGHVLLETKAIEPLEWINFEGVAPAGSVGATEEFPGVFFIIDRGSTEWGTMKSYYREYFDSGGKIFNGTFVCRLLKNIWGPELTGTAKMIWMGWYSAEPIPYVIRKRAVDKNWMPPDGQSALPRVVRKHVPAKLRYWEKTGAKAHRLRDQLVKEKIFTKKTLGFNTKNELDWKE